MPITIDETTTEAVQRFFGTWYGSIISVVVIVVLALVARWIWHRFVRRTTTTFTQSAVTRYLTGDKESPRDRDMAIERYRDQSIVLRSIVFSALPLL